MRNTSPILIALTFFLILSGAVCKKTVDSDHVQSDLDKIQLPKGFKIEVFAEVKNARSMVLGDKGTLFVGTRGRDEVWAVRDEDGDFKADTVMLIAKDLYSPNGVAFRDGDLYVAEINEILRFEAIEDHLDNPPKPVSVYDSLPNERHHGWKYIAFGPDGKLYVPVGAPCNICERTDDPRFASILRMNHDGTNAEIFAHGIRNTVGFAWDPATKDLWFTDNGRDWLGEDLPNDELNHAPKPGMHFGYPYCHQGDTPDPELADDHTCDEFTAPAQKLGPHVAALGMKFYTGKMFPESYKNNIFIALHGSWNRSEPIGYKVVRARVEGGKVVEFDTFAEGWLQENGKPFGRPVDILEMPDGSLLVSDDHGNKIYRISYEG